MTIKNKDAFMGALWDWGFLDECFNKTKIKVSDVDGIVERNGHVLFIEAKPPGKEVSVGQSIMFSALAQSGFTVLVIWGETNKPKEFMFWKPYQVLPSKKMAATEETIKSFVRHWYVCVDEMGRGSKRKMDKKGKWLDTLRMKINGDD